MKRKLHKISRFVVCIDNEGYKASLEQRKLYPVIADAKAEENRLIRIVDESGEDYLYPADFFMPIPLPKTVERAISLAC